MALPPHIRDSVRRLYDRTCDLLRRVWVATARFADGGWKKLRGINLRLPRPEPNPYKIHADLSGLKKHYQPYSPLIPKLPRARVPRIGRATWRRIGWGVLGGTAMTGAVIVAEHIINRQWKEGGEKTREPLYVGTTEMMRTAALQENLLMLGYKIDDCGANGIFTDRDLGAVNAFRRAADMDTSDFVDNKTERLIALKVENNDSLDAARDSAQDRAALRAIQVQLMQLGYNIGDCQFNGRMTPETRKSIIAFKTAEKIAPANDEITRKFKKKLASAAAAQAQGTAAVVDMQGEDYYAAVLYGQEQDVEKLALEYIRSGVPEYIVQSIMEANMKTGMDFMYLMQMARQESGYRPWVGAGSSTAVGPFQFVQQTWLHTLKEHGHKYGYGDLARSIKTNAAGKCYIKGDAGLREYILDLRKDPKLSALMASEYAFENLRVLRRDAGGTIGKPELYLAHFLGAGDGARFIREFRKNPQKKAAPLFPDAAESNPTVFNGRTLGDIYRLFARKMPGRVLHVGDSKVPKKFTDTVAVPRP